MGARKLNLCCVETFRKDRIEIAPSEYDGYSITASNGQQKIILILRSDIGSIPIDVTHEIAQGHFKKT